MLFRYFTDLVDIDDHMEKDYQGCYADVLVLFYTVFVYKMGSNLRSSKCFLKFCMLSVSV